MEVAGKKEDEDLTNSSDQIPSPVCQPCSSEGIHLDAEGYCQTCKEFLCQNCYKAHTIPRPLRHHVLLDKSKMPLDTKTTQTTRAKPCTTPCDEHLDEYLKFLCESHDIVVCGVCSVLNHQKPCNLRYIQDINHLSSYHTSTEFKSLVDRLETLERNISAGITQVSDNKDMIEEKINSILEDYEALRREVDEYFNKKEKQLKKMMVQMKQQDETSLQSLLDDLNSLKNEVEEKKTKLAMLENETSNLYAASKRINKQMSKFEKMFDEYQHKNKEPHYKLKMDTAVQRLLSSDDFGVVERSYKAYPMQQEFTTAPTQSPTLDFKSAVAKRLPDIQTRLGDNDEKPWVTGVASLSPSILLIVDYFNMKVKAIDTNTNTVTSHLSLGGYPWDITTLPDDEEVAVTLPCNQHIDVISTRDKLRLLRSINVDGWCYGICSSGQNIIVLFRNPAMVQVMNMAGAVLSTIRTNDQGEDLFDDPSYLTVAEAETVDVILVSDYNKNVISKLTMAGKLMSTYRHGTWNRLRGIVGVGNNQLLVCNSGGHTVDVVSGDGEVVTLLDKEKHGVIGPSSLCYIKSEGKLYVGAKDSLKVYKLSQK